MIFSAFRITVFSVIEAPGLLFFNLPKIGEIPKICEKSTGPYLLFLAGPGASIRGGLQLEGGLILEQIRCFMSPISFDNQPYKFLLKQHQWDLYWLSTIYK